MTMTTETHNAAASLDKVEHVTFYLGDVLFGIDIAIVDEINRHDDVTPVPHAPPYVCGVLNLRGEVITVVDLRMILNLPAAAGDVTSRTVIVRYQGEQIGLRVDRIADVVQTSGDHIEPSPANTHGADSRFLKGVYKSESGLMIILDVEAALSHDEGDD